MVITNRTALQPVRVGLEIAAALWKLHGDAYQMETTERLLGSRQSLDRVKAGEDPSASRPAGLPPKRAGVSYAPSICCIGIRALDLPAKEPVNKLCVPSDSLLRADLSN